MCVPDLELICENMLLAQGFVEAKSLTKKFTTLYRLNKDLLSKQDHYDWGLRAIKSVLVVAGMLRRDEPSSPEEAVLMRALRDFNLPKIVKDDEPVFLGLINDLFPGRDLRRKRDPEFESVIRKTTLESGLQPEEGFLLKVVNLQELLDVRHCVFIIGNSKVGKSEIWKTLAKSNTARGKRTIHPFISPKAVTANELYGYMNRATQEWKDGIFSTVMRDLSNMPDKNPKWIILDGDIDPEWIESLNTVMDDNKILTLANNERISLHPHMRLIFEVLDLKQATPATVSRGGVLYVNEKDVGWESFVNRWAQARPKEFERTFLQNLFEKNCTVILEFCSLNKMEYVVPVSDFSRVQTCVYLLESMLDGLSKSGAGKESVVDADAVILETLFNFCAVWAFGGSLSTESQNFPDLFNNFFRREFRSSFPENGSVFDYCYDVNTKSFALWTDRVSSHQFNPLTPLYSLVVPTVDTVRISTLMELLIRRRRPVMLAGAGGCGKTVMATEVLTKFRDTADLMFMTLNLNYYTDSATLQKFLEQPLEKRVGRTIGPPGGRQLVYFIDDMNMPQVDKYGTQSAVQLLRMQIDYGSWYDRSKLSLKEIQDIQYLAAMNPKAGSFTVNPRLQGHFSTFAVNFPSKTHLQHIYSQIVEGHLRGFKKDVFALSQNILNAMISLHFAVMTGQDFLPNAIKFHYQFNVRDLAAVVQGLLLAHPQVITEPSEMIRVWLHESWRVYGDRLISERDIESFDKICKATVNTFFTEYKDECHVSPNIFCHFAQGNSEKVYASVPSYKALGKMLTETLTRYNEEKVQMNLVLFDEAMNHVCRINRVLELPRGNCMLVGVGGSGKQSLARLAAYISGCEVFQITITGSYSVNDLRESLKALYIRTGVKGVPTVFLFVDTQITNEKFLVYINDMLSIGVPPDLFAIEEKDEIINNLRNEVKLSGTLDSNENCWEFFLNKVRVNLKVVLCFSPVGEAFRLRSRKFPALVNCAVFDWFHGWPREALLSVAKRFLEDIELPSADVRDAVVEFMAFAHVSVNATSSAYLESEKRYNYTTPKSFLELIAFFRSLLNKKRTALYTAKEKLEIGMLKLESTAKDVTVLREHMKVVQVEVEEKKKQASSMLEIVGQEKAKVDAEKALAEVESEKCAVMAREVEEFQDQCNADLAKAEPAIFEAEKALNSLDKASISELKNFTKAHVDVENVFKAVLILQSPPRGIVKDLSWAAAKKAMANVDRFLDDLRGFKGKIDSETVPPVNFEGVRQYLAMDSFDPVKIKSKSVAAAGICAWVRNIVIYYDIYCEVAPKRVKLKEATTKLEDASTRLKGVQRRVAQLDAKLTDLTNKYSAATEEKNAVIARSQTLQEKLESANRLVHGLSGEGQRWSETIQELKSQENFLVGDVLVSAAFVSYCGFFTNSFRRSMLNDKWLPYVRENPQLKTTENLDILTLLTSSSTIAKWNNEGLPADQLSIENGVIVTSSARWPLLVDPQLQGKNWLISSVKDLKVIRANNTRFMTDLEKAISSGYSVMIEDIADSLDAVLDPVLARNTFKKGNQILMRLGDKEVDYDPNFRLYLQTKLGNPHYKPEIQAQCTLVNFTVTEDGLEEQLLAMVVEKEKPELQQLKAELMQMRNDCKIKLQELQDELLDRLSNAKGDLIDDIELIHNLEATKKTAEEISVKVEEAKQTEETINKVREKYRPVSQRGALLYFLINDLNKIEAVYQYSLKAFVRVFLQAVNRAQQADEIEERNKNLIDTITYAVFRYVARGLFTRHKLIFTVQMCFRISERKKTVDPQEMAFLLRAPRTGTKTKPNEALSWVPEVAWDLIQSLKTYEGFERLPEDMEAGTKRWKEWFESIQPENEPLPQDWKKKSKFQQLLIMRALRPDRISYALSNFLGSHEDMGLKYVEGVPFRIDEVFPDTTTTTPLFFILSPGVDPLKDVEALGLQLGFSEESGKFKNVSLGQGQDKVAEDGLEMASKEGGWIFLQNIHLVARWLPKLEKLLEELCASAHPDFRVFLSAEPSADPTESNIPLGILQNSIKVTNEPPTSFRDNLRASFSNFTADELEACTSKPTEFKSILFAMCYFHATVIGRKKFGYQGWSRSYPFNTGDLRISAEVLLNYLDSQPKIPWDDLRYLFGEIIYGGHITDNWDRRTCQTYLNTFLTPELFEEMELAQGLTMLLPGATYETFKKYIEEKVPMENPTLYRLHPNAELGFLTAQSDSLFRTLLELQPRQSGDGNASARDEQNRAMVDNLLEQIPILFDMEDIISRIEGLDPYTGVFLQECDRMNNLLAEMRRSLTELKLGLNGELMMSERMDTLLTCLLVDKVPATWTKLAYPSLKPLGSWVIDVLRRVRQLVSWTGDCILPKCVWLSGLFNPGAFLTAVMQVAARKNNWPLDKMTLQTEMTKMSSETVNVHHREGAYIEGLFLQGARWDNLNGVLRDSNPKELFSPLPVMLVKGITVDKRETRDVYECPVYITSERGPTYTCSINMKTKEPASKWILGGVACLMHAD
eukprot:GILJ01004897.1.p1 GENE.GILJ01004897.1~~GILJ01004897.1.p1  ORF type:complete len:2544 (-),score=425.95 GILJ01004897.1:114-7634(-)